jgi:hypothetical protein
MKYHVISIEYGPGATLGFLAQAWDIDSLHEKYQPTFTQMEQDNHTVKTIDNLVFLIK